MGTNTEQQYKLLNAELMGHVQRLRVEVGEYKKLVVNLKTELLEEREFRVLEMDHRKRQLKGAISALIKDLELDRDILVGVADTQKENFSSPPANRRSTIKEVCREMRRFSDITRSARTSSPSSRRSRTLRASSTSSSSIVTEDVIDVDETTEVDATIAPEETQRLIINSVVTPPPRRIAELTSALDDSDEDSPTIDVVKDLPTCVDEEQTVPDTQYDQAANLFSIMEETDSELTSDTDSDSSFHCISTSEESLDTTDTPTPVPSGRARVLRELCDNVPNETVTHIRENPKKPALANSCYDVDSSQELSIHKPRQLLSPMHLSVASPRQSQFNGIHSVAGSTSTPHSSPVLQKRDRGRPRKSKLLTSKGSLSTSANSVEEDHISASCSTSGRPSRKCRPTSMKEPRLNTKLRDNSLSKKF